MADMSTPPIPENPPAVVDDDILEKLLKTRSGKRFEDLRDTAIFRSFFDTGARLAEVQGLTQGDVDLRQQLLTVLGKGNRLRVVPIGDKTTTAIDKYLRSLEREYPEAVGDDRALWAGRQGPLKKGGMNGVLYRMCSDAGVQRLHWHQLRHTAAHVWQLNDGNEGDLMEIMGWRSRAMLDRYGKSARVQRAHASHRPDVPRRSGLKAQPRVSADAVVTG